VHYGSPLDPDAVDIASLFSGSRSAYLGKEVKRRILLGTWCLSSGFYDAFYDRALRIRSLLKADFDAAFRAVDLVLCPTTPSPAWRLGEKISDPVQMYLADILTGACNLAGIPGLAVPCGTSAVDGKRLPIGAQLMGPAFSESLLLRAGAVIEDACWDPSVVPNSGSASRAPPSNVGSR
jgi:aspartyl-tRNA(Asn)/glutamyl-tRNA(Gln) amidotransferase subunit A